MTATQNELSTYRYIILDVNRYELTNVREYPTYDEFHKLISVKSIVFIFSKLVKKILSNSNVITRVGIFVFYL